MRYFWMKKAALATLGCAALLSTVSCNQLPFRSPFDGPKEPELGELPTLSEAPSAETLKVVWSAHPLSKQDRFAKLLPTVSGDTIYTADHAGHVVAMSRSDGKTLWKTKVKPALTAGPALVEGSLIVATDDATVMAINAMTGKIQWESKVPSEVLASPTGQEGIVIAHAIDGSLTALDLKQGNTLWQVEQTVPSLTLHYLSAPVVVGDKVLAGFSSGKLMAFNLHTGLVEWERTITLPRGRSELQRMVDITADPLMTDDTIYVVTYQGKLAAVDIATGALNWDLEISAYQNMAMDAEHIYVTDNNYDLWAIDKYSGATRWKQNALESRYITGPCVMNNRVVVADRGGYLHMLSTDSGHLIDRYEFNGKIFQNPVTLGRQMLVSNHRGKMAVLTLDDVNKAG